MKSIMLKIIGKQIGRNGEEDIVELITEGKYYKKGGATYLVYEEKEMTGLEDCTTTLKITDDAIKMKRFGTTSSEIVFQKGKRCHVNYNTLYGNFEMEVLTQQIENNLFKNDAGGSLSIEYDISLKGLSEGRNKINIEIMNTKSNLNN